MSDQNANVYGRRPSMCRNCGAIVAAGEEACPQCGAPLAPTNDQIDPRRSVYDREAMRFARAVLTRPHTFTIIFLVANLFVFMLMWYSSGLNSSALMEFPEPVLVAYGAKLNYLINARPHQWWRFVTPIFIHINLPHILVNMWSLWVVGPYVEKLYGSAKFVFFWVLTGVAGVAASYLTVQPEMHVDSVGRFLFKTMDNPSAGASGALFGLVGVLFVFGIKFRHELPEGFKRAFGTGLLPMIMLNLFIGYLGRGFIDNAAHLGGFFAGAAVALFVGYKRPGERTSVAVFWHILQSASLVLVAASFLMVARNFPKTQLLAPEPARRVKVAQNSEAQTQAQNQIKAYIEAINQGQKALIGTLTGTDSSGIEPALKALGDAPRLDEEAGGLIDELKSLLERARAYRAMNPGKAQRAEGKKIVADYEAWQGKRDRWLKENGDKYQIELVPVGEDEKAKGNK